MEGWIKLHRKLLEWEWYHDTNTKSLFIHLLIISNHRDTKRRGETIKKGQVLTGRFKLSEETGLSQQQIRTSLTKLKSTSEITIKSTNKYSVITLINWEKYQIEEKNQPAKQPTEQPTTNQQVTTSNNNKNINNNILSKDNNNEVVSSRRNTNIDLIVDFMKDCIEANSLVYDSIRDRQFSKHLLSNKFKEEISDIMGLDQIESIKRLIRMATVKKFKNKKENFRHGKVLGPKDLYQKRSKILNNYLLLTKK